MLDRYEYINPELAESLICSSYNVNPLKTDDTINKYYNIKSYVIVHKCNILLADGETAPTNEYYFDIMKQVMKLYENNVYVQPILGYTINEHTIKTTESADVIGAGYVILAKQKGDILYDFSKMPNPFSLNKSNDEDKKINYLLTTIEKVSNIPQSHYDKFADDLKKIMNGGLKFDIFSPSNIVYDGGKGFIFTNINHKLSKFKTEDEFNKCFIRNCLSLCFANFEFSENISHAIKNQLKDFNKVIFEKCVAALQKQGISADLVKEYSTNIWKN